ncbi:MAG: NTP transferase domain-containing protein [Armatimonadetes bacterium]|nr:NTP transferase domain-containing protein [Armatimonadota bacterium]
MSPMRHGFQAVILAAGKGTRMGSDLPKVLLSLAGRPVLAHILDSLAQVGITRPVVVIGTGGELVRGTLGDCCIYAVQEEQLGSGHAVMCARDATQDADNILVMCGDSPLFRVETIRSVMEAHLRERATITLVSAILDDPRGYGRVLRGPGGEVSGIVEEKLATEEQKAIGEINGGLYAFDAPWLWENIGLMRRNEAGEYCLTEMVEIAISQGCRVIAVSASPDEVAGINTPDQLLAAERVLLARKTSNL